MKATEFAAYLTELAPLLTHTVRSDMDALAGFLREYPEASVQKLLTDLAKLLARESNTPAKLAQRIRDYRDSPGDSVTSLQEAIAGQTFAGIQQVFRTLGFHPASALGESKNLLEDYLIRGVVPPKPEPSLEARAMVEYYRDLQDQARGLGYDEILSRFRRIEGQKAPVVKEVAVELGYAPAKTKKENLAKLLESLQKLREMEQRTGLI